MKEVKSSSVESVSKSKDLTPPSISVIIPVLNESAGINSLISRIQSLDFQERPEIIVVDGDPGGGTLKAIHDANVKKIKSPAGRGRQMNQGAKAARGHILLFLHADTELPLDAPTLIASAMENKRYAAGAFDLGIRSERLPFRLIETMASLRSRVTRIPFGDQAIFMRKHYFDKIGGFKDIPLMEDVEIMRRIRKKGDKIAIIKKRVYTSARRWEQEGIVRCTLRNWLLLFLYAFGVSPHRLAKFYRHH